MNDSQRARKLADDIEEIIDEKYERYAQTVAERLNEEFSPFALSVAGDPATRWDELKTHPSPKASFTRYDRYIRQKVLFRIIERTPCRRTFCSVAVR